MKDEPSRVRIGKRIVVSSAFRTKLLDRHHHRCQSCGATENLELAAIVPFVEGGESSLDNFLILCPSCHAAYDSFQPQEGEFSAFLYQLLADHPQYENESLEKLLDPRSRARADLFADRISSGQRRSLLVECKNRCHRPLQNAPLVATSKCTTLGTFGI
jgi:hypothetical protein